jgi:hypothetical protein
VTNRKRLEVLDELIHDYNEAGNKALDDAWKLENEREATLAKIITEDQLLAGLWLLIPSKTTIRLRGSTNIDRDKLEDLLKPDFHQSFSLWDSIQLHFDDGLISLLIPYGKVRSFIQMEGIRIDEANLKERRDDLSAKLVTMNSLLAIAHGPVRPGDGAIRPPGVVRFIRPPREF